MRTRAEFLAARRGRRLNGPLFFIEARDRQDGAEARLGLTVTRKVGNAVERNRIRRRLREAVRLECGADMAEGFDFVVVARRDLLSVPFAMLKSELSRRFARARPDRPKPGGTAGGHPSGTD
ncbi:ribonuclease P protein component [Aureimonas sp. SA4125]|uniref:ribonuclease P protein component n=1 Tax=Aureimonas sp. SA4125 TaxID=2826993 RepID=UPI001CC5A3CD|nr:ribonuclease P protein component [Aureimonas sp. SA4125]